MDKSQRLRNSGLTKNMGCRSAFSSAAENEIRFNVLDRFEGKSPRRTADFVSTLEAIPEVDEEYEEEDSEASERVEKQADQIRPPEIPKLYREETDHVLYGP